MTVSKNGQSYIYIYRQDTEMPREKTLENRKSMKTRIRKTNAGRTNQSSRSEGMNDEEEEVENGGVAPNATLMSTTC